jgi:hypothetical protein
MRDKCSLKRWRNLRIFMHPSRCCTKFIFLLNFYAYRVLYGIVDPVKAQVSSTLPKDVWHHLREELGRFHRLF